jgi:hypothetical protein
MEWLGFIALVALLLVVRRLILWRWRNYRLSHRQAAALYTAVMPLVLLIAFAINGIGSLGQLLLVVGIALFVFGSTYAFAEFFLRAMSGETDPPGSRGYRRRP